MKHWAITLAASALALSACGQQGGSLGQRALNTALGEQAANTSETQARFQQLLQTRQPFALDVQLETSGIRGGFLREARRGRQETWLGSDGVTLSFDRGVLTGSAGFGSALQAADVRETASAVLAGRNTQVERIHSLLGGDDRIQQRAFVCDVEVAGREVIPLDRGATATRKMRETCYSLDERYTNEYWVDTRQGRIVLSRQWGGAEVGMLRIQAVFNY